MVGIGCGARSYTEQLHYSSEYGVKRHSVAEILEHYLTREEDAFAYADYGVALNEEERRRRYVIQSLLTFPGLELSAYRQRFGGDCFEQLPQLRELLELELATAADGWLRLNDTGLARADTIGPWLTSLDIMSRMRDYQLA